MTSAPRRIEDVFSQCAKRDPCVGRAREAIPVGGVDEVIRAHQRRIPEALGRERDRELVLGNVAPNWGSINNLSSIATSRACVGVAHAPRESEQPSGAGAGIPKVVHGAALDGNVAGVDWHFAVL